MFRARDSNLWYSKSGIHIRQGNKYIEVKRQYQPSTLKGLSAAKCLDSGINDTFGNKIISSSGEIFECVQHYEICDHNYNCRCSPQISVSTVAAQYASLASFEHIYAKPLITYVPK